MRIERRSVSPVIATLLLILISIAAGVIVYSYVIGFVSNSSANPGATTSVISIISFCASTTSLNHCSGNVFQVTILNAGTTAIAGGGGVYFQLYFTDATSPMSASTTCAISSNLSPGQTLVCPVSTLTTWSGIFTSSPSAGDSITVKVVAPDGGAATSSTKAI